jgi:hypothetical protein
VTRRAWSRGTSDALFVGSTVGEPARCVVVTGAVAVAGVGAVAVVALFIPGAVAARIAVMAA